MGELSADAGEAVLERVWLDAGLHKALTDQLDEGVCVVNRDHQILYRNHGPERLSGYLAHEVAGQFSHGDLLMHCENDGSVLPGQACAISDAIRDGKPRDCTVLLRHREGHRLLVRLQSRPIQDAHGAMIGALEVFEEALPRRINWRSQLEAMNAFEIPFGWLRIGLDGAQDLERGYGHGMVDAAIKMIAATLDGNLAGVDVLTRWEASEFRVEVSRCSRRHLASAAERLRLPVRASTLEWWGDRLRVIVSVGGATAEPGDTIQALEERVAQVYGGCVASGGDRSAGAHLIRSEAPGSQGPRSGAEPCSP